MWCAWKSPYGLTMQQSTSLRYPRSLLLPQLRLLSVPWALWFHLCCCREVWREVPEAEEGTKEESEEEHDDLPLYAVCWPDKDICGCESRLCEIFRQDWQAVHAGESKHERLRCESFEKEDHKSML